jgi:outer membrane protein, heavy metal efflux system
LRCAPRAVVHGVFIAPTEEGTDNVQYFRVLPRQSLASFIVLGLVASTPAGADGVAESSIPAQLDLHSALGMFRQNGLDLLIADATVRSAEGDIKIADAIPNPQLSVTYGPYAFYWHCAGGCNAPSFWAVGLSDSAAIEDSISGKRHLRDDVAAAALKATQLTRTDTERQLAFAVKAAFQQVLLAQSALQFAKETEAANATMLDKADKQREADKIQRPDLLRVKIAKLESDQAVDQAQQNLRKARSALAYLLGVRSTNPQFTAVEPQLEKFSVPATLAQADHDALLAQAYAARPDLAAQEAQVASADAAVRLAKRQRFPDITLSLGYTQQGATEADSASPPTFSIGLAGALPVFYQQQGDILKAEAQLQIQQLQVAKIKATIRNDFEGAYADYLGSRDLVQRMEGGELLDTARQARDDIKLLYEKGGAQLTDYLLALATYISTNLEYLNDIANYWTAVFELEQALGKELR